MVGRFADRFMIHKQQALLLDITSILKIRPQDNVHEPPVRLWNIDTQFGRAGKFLNVT